MPLEVLSRTGPYLGIKRGRLYGLVEVVERVHHDLCKVEVASAIAHLAAVWACIP